MQTFEQFMQQLDLQQQPIDNFEDRDIANVAVKVVQQVLKTIPTAGFDAIRSQISPYFEHNLQQLRMFHHVLVLADPVSELVLNETREIYLQQQADVVCAHMVPAFITVALYVDCLQCEIAVDEKFASLVEQHVVDNFLLHLATKSWICDRPNSKFDFKRALITVFKTGKLYHDDTVLQDGYVTRKKLFRVLANYLYLRNQPYVNELFQQRGWNDEIRFIHQVFDIKKRRSKTTNEFLASTVRTILDKLPETMTDSLGDGTKITPSHDELFLEFNSYSEKRYKYKRHAEALFTALSYYCSHIEPAIVDEYVSNLQHDASTS